MIKVLKPGMLTTVQDLGRLGYAHLGVSPAGAADSISFRAANLLAGNFENAPALEFTLLGPVLEFQREATIAITGAETSRSMLTWRSLSVKAGTTVDVGAMTSGARCYMAVKGGIRVPEVMDSASTFLPGALGGFEGRALKAGDLLYLGDFESPSPSRKFSATSLRELIVRKTLRVVPAAQAGWFAPEGEKTFYSSTFTISDQSNRSGVRLIGDPIVAKEKRELLTEGVTLGAIQVPADGQPIILFVDQQTTGGYPKIAGVIAADLPSVGQLRPHDRIRFRQVSVDEAVEALREQERCLYEAFA